MAKGINITIDNTDVYNKINALINKIDKPKPLLKIIGKYIQSLTKKMFVGRRPDAGGVRGEKWPKLAKITIERKLSTKKQTKRLIEGPSQSTKKIFAIAGEGQIGNPRRPLLASGRLKSSLLKKSAIKINNKGLVYGTDIKSMDGFNYPAIHQTGGDNTPQRRWLFLTSKELMQIATTTRDWLKGKRKDVM